MSWDWEKLKQQQQGRGGVPPQMDEFVEKIKRIKFPGGPLFIILVILVALGMTTFYTVKQNEVGIIQLFGRYGYANRNNDGDLEDDYQVHAPSAGFIYELAEDARISLGGGYFYQKIDGGDSEQGFFVNADAFKV